MSSAGALVFEHGYALSTGRWTTDNNQLVLDAWQHVAVVVYDSALSASAPQLFINGQQVAVTRTSTPVGPALTDSGQQLTVGNQAGSGNRTFAGRIDELHACSAALSAGQFAAGCSSSSCRRTAL